MLEVRQSPLHGQGVYASRRIRSGELLEVCPVLRLTAEDIDHVEQTSFRGYWFEWGDGEGGLALGHLTLCNHSFAPNARVETDEAAGVIRVFASRAIAAGEEVLIDYTNGAGADWLWFDPD